MKTRILICCLLLCFAICGCASKNAISSTEPTEGMLDDIFTQEPSDEAEKLPPSYFSHSLETPQMTYNGEELRVPVVCSGNIGAKVAYLLVLDGRPQPYKLSEEGEYSYMHTITMQKGRTTFDFIFQPVVGSVGETLELCVVNINDPEHRVSKNGVAGSKHTSGSIPIVATIEFLADSSAANLPAMDEGILSISAEYADVTANEIDGWSEEDLRNRSEYTIAVNGRDTLSTYGGISTAEPITIHLELWGNPDAEFGLLFFQDGKPIAAKEADTLLLHNEQGKKLIADIQIEGLKKDEESVLYVLLVYRNIYEMSFDGIPWFADAMTYYLIPQAQP